MVKKHTRTIISTTENPAPLSGELYGFVLGQIIVNPAERSLIRENDLSTLERLPGRRHRQFVQAERSALRSICGRMKGPKDFDITDVAQEFDNARADGERDLLRQYEEAIAKLSNDTQRYIEQRLAEAASQVQFVDSQVDLFELSLEAPEMADTILSRGCERFEKAAAREPLRDTTLLDEISDSQQFAPISTNRN